MWSHKKLAREMARMGAFSSRDMALVIDNRPLRLVLPGDDYRAFRQHIIEKVRIGELTPDEAEMRAKDNHDDPFQDIPEKFGMVATMTPEMAAIWITKKNLKAMHRHYKSSYEGRSVWVKNEMRFPPPMPGPIDPRHSRKIDWHSRAGYDLEPLTETYLFSSFISFEGQERKFPAVRDWFEELRQTLAHGEISAYGFPVSDERLRQPIPCQVWHDVEFGTENGQAVETVLKVNGRTAYSKVLFEAAGILKIAPTIPYLKWKAEPGKMAPLTRRVFNSLKNGSPMGLPNGKPIGKMHEQLLEFLEEDVDRKRWAQPGSFTRYLREKKKLFCD